MPMPAAERQIEKFFLLYLLINPLLDVYSGAYSYIGSLISGEKLTMLITPTLIVRMVMLLLFAYYLLSLRDKQSVRLCLLIGLAGLCSIVGEILFAASFSLFADLQYLAKFLYNILIILVYWRIFQRSAWGREQLLAWLNWLLSLISLVISLFILVPFLLGLGYSTYSDRFGNFGSRGFFYSGNDITAVLMLLLPLAIVTYLLLERNSKTRWQRLFYLLAPATNLTALVAISTKTSFLALGVTLAAVFAYCLLQRRKSGGKDQLKAFARIMLAFVILFVFMSMFGLVQSLIESGDRLNQIDDEGYSLVEKLLSGREEKVKAAFVQFRTGGPYAWAFGIGRGSQTQIIEMDFFEALFYYGIIGAAIMLWLYFRLGFGLIRHFRHQPDAYGLACFLSIGLCTAYLVLAGHVIFSVTSGFYFAFILLYSHLYYAENTAAWPILPAAKPPKS